MTGQVRMHEKGKRVQIGLRLKGTNEHLKNVTTIVKARTSVKSAYACVRWDQDSCTYINQHKR